MPKEIRDYEPPEPKISLPKVSKETVQSLFSEFENMTDEEQGQHLEKMFEILKSEDRILYQAIKLFINSTEHEDTTEVKAESYSTALFVYELLRRQSMVDQLKKEVEGN
jgi:hypothetical protein